MLFGLYLHNRLSLLHPYPLKIANQICSIPFLILCLRNLLKFSVCCKHQHWSGWLIYRSQGIKYSTSIFYLRTKRFNQLFAVNEFRIDRNIHNWFLGTNITLKITCSANQWSNLHIQIAYPVMRNYASNILTSEIATYHLLLDRTYLVCFGRIDFIGISRFHS